MEILNKIKLLIERKHLAGKELPKYYKSVLIERRTGDFRGVNIMEGHLIWTETIESNVWVGDVGHTKDIVFDVKEDDIWKYI